ncbi:MAG: sugar phosphate isomerase/epimerase family protein [Pirellulaceae bacterium]
MERLAVNEMTTYRWTFEEDVEHYVKAGVRGIGVWRQKLSDFGEERGIELIADSGLKVSSLLWAGGFTGSEGTTHRESIADALHAIRQAAAIGSGALVLYTGARAGHTHNHARRLMRGALKAIAPLAEELGVSLAIEPMHPGCAADWTFLTDIDDTLALLDAVDSPAAKLCFDTYQLAQDPAVLDRIHELAPRTALVQLGDAKRPPDGEQDRCLLGEGVIPLGAVIAAFDAAGYDGFYELELLGEEIEAADYVDLLQRSKLAYADLLGVAGP